MCETTEEKLPETNFPDRLTRIVKENHGKPIQGIELCPFEELNNIVATCGSNQIYIYDCTHRGNYMDLVSNFYNKPQSLEQQQKLLNPKPNPNPTAKIHKQKFKFSPEQIYQLTFKCLCWINRAKQKDFWILSGCQDGKIYCISYLRSACVSIFPASRRAIEQIFVHNNPKYSSNIIFTIDDKHITKIWNIDLINSDEFSNFQFDDNGDLIEVKCNKIADCLLRINDPLTTICMSPNNLIDNNSTVFYGATLDGHIKCYKIDHKQNNKNNKNKEKNENKNKESEDEDVDIDIDLNDNNNGEIEIWKNCEEISKLKVGKNVKITTMIYRPGKDYSNQLIFFDQIGKFWIYNTATEKTFHRFDLTNGIDGLSSDIQYSFDITNNGKYLGYGNGEGNVYIYDLDNKKIIKRLAHTRCRRGLGMSHVRFAPPNGKINGDSIVSVSESILWKWDTFDWVKEFRQTTSFFENETPFMKRVPNDPTYVDF